VLIPTIEGQFSSQASTIALCYDPDYDSNTESNTESNHVDKRHASGIVNQLNQLVSAELDLVQSEYPLLGRAIDPGVGGLAEEEKRQA
jgi:hypothetical protein